MPNNRIARSSCASPECSRWHVCVTFRSSSEAYNPFYVGFDNRITNALSHRSVNVPRFPILPLTPSEVKMELLKLAGYKSSYIHMLADTLPGVPPPRPLPSFFRPECTL